MRPDSADPTSPSIRPPEPSGLRRFLNWLAALFGVQPVELPRALPPGTGEGSPSPPGAAPEPPPKGDAAEVGAAGGTVREGPSEGAIHLPSEALRRLAERLALEEIDAGIARALMQEILRELPPERWDQEVEVYSVAAWVLMRWAQVAGPLKIKRGAMTVVALVGPTGVGKSTTLAKLASIAALKEKNAVGLISTDTYRIAAAEQIKAFARLLGLPLAVVRTREEMQAALNEYAQRDVVFVDTAGQSPNDFERLRELEEMLRTGDTIRRHLVLSATTKHSDVQDILTRFDSLEYDGLVITKLDESRSHGILLNAPHWSGRPLTYLGVGQGIPRDVEVASKERVVDLMLNLSGRFLKKG